MARPKNMNVVRVTNYDDHNDDFPTPPWAVRAFLTYVTKIPRGSTVLEPACGRRHMEVAFKEFGLKTLNYDKNRYGAGHKIADYTNGDAYPAHDFVITNPPYKQANQFALRALKEAEYGVGLLLRTIWMESVTRHDQLFGVTPPTTVAVFSRRMQAAQGKLVRNGGAMMSHSWFWWDKTKPARPGQTRLMWLPPDAQSKLDKDGDYT